MVKLVADHSRNPGFRRLLTVVFGGWILLSLLTAPGVYLQSESAGQAIRLEFALGHAFTTSLPWAVVALLVLVFNQLARQRGGLNKTGMIAQLILGIAAVFVIVSLSWLWHWPVLGLSGAMYNADYGQTLSADLPRSFAIFLGIWGLCQLGLLWRAYRYLKRRFIRTELRRLRTQLNPHFLFNTLNAIAELGYKDPASADRTITQLSSLLRKSLDDSHQQEIALRDELDFLRRYLDIQQTLLQGRLEVELAVPDDTLNARVPGMILQPLVENAVTHGIGRSGSGYLKISAARRGEVLVIAVEDNGWGLVIAAAHGSREGIGIRNTRARFHYLYGELASLELHSRPGEGLTARLNIPFHEAYAYDENPYPDS